jgi:hypothetical protein
MTDKSYPEQYIESLTPEQEELLPVYRDKWIKIGLNCDPIDRVKAEEEAKKAYAEVDLVPPEKFIVANGPLSANVAAGIVKISRDYNVPPSTVFNTITRDTPIWDSCNPFWDSVQEAIVEYDDHNLAMGFNYDGQLPPPLTPIELKGLVLGSAEDYIGENAYGSHDAHWLGFYNYFLEVCDLRVCEKLLPLMELAKVCGWWIPFEDFCILQERHCELHRNEDGRLHNPDGMAVKYPDGYGGYFWNGVPIDSHDYAWIITDPDSITVDKINEETNQEMKRIMMEQLGYQEQKIEIAEIFASVPPGELRDTAIANLEPIATVGLKRYFSLGGGGTPVDRNELGEALYLRDMKDGEEPIAMIYVQNRTQEPDGSYKWYMLRVPPTTKTVNEGVAWSFGVEDGGIEFAQES